MATALILQAFLLIFDLTVGGDTPSIKNQQKLLNELGMMIGAGKIKTSLALDLG